MNESLCRVVYEKIHKKLNNTADRKNRLKLRGKNIGNVFSPSPFEKPASTYCALSRLQISSIRIRIIQ